MRFPLPCYVIEIEMQIEKADTLLALIDEAIEQTFSTESGSDRIKLQLGWRIPSLPLRVLTHGR